MRSLLLALSLIGITLSTPTKTIHERAPCPALPNPLPSFSALPPVPTLTNPFKFFNGETIRTPQDWTCRQQELKIFVQEYLYGYYPDHSKETVRATRSGENVTVHISAGKNSTSFAFQLTFPNTTTSSKLHLQKFPILINPGSTPTDPFTSLGIALATFDYSTVAVDAVDDRVGAFWDLYQDRDIGVLTAWAWGYHRVLDAIELVVPEIDTSKVGAIGCSRFGKAALAAGIFDERVTVTLPLSSGAEGIGPWRFYYETQGAAEMIQNIFGGFPYWSTSRLGQFVNDSSRLPFDAHSAVSLVSPRAIIWDEGSTDWWTNPEGVSSVVFEASKVIFNWLGVGDRVGITMRQPPVSGHCDPTGFTNVAPFLSKFLQGTPTTSNFSDISPFVPHPSAYPWYTALPKIW